MPRLVAGLGHRMAEEFEDMVSVLSCLWFVKHRTAATREKLMFAA